MGLKEDEIRRDRLEAARIEVLNKQRVCGWCEHIAESSNGLVRHILENSMSHRGRLLDPVEQELLAKLQEEGA